MAPVLVRSVVKLDRAAEHPGGQRGEARLLPDMAIDDDRLTLLHSCQTEDGRQPLQRVQASLLVDQVAEGNAPSAGDAAGPGRACRQVLLACPVAAVPRVHDRGAAV